MALNQEDFKKIYIADKLTCISPRQLDDFYSKRHNKTVIYRKLAQASRLVNNPYLTHVRTAFDFSCGSPVLFPSD